MRNLNSKKARKEIANLITEYGYYSEWKELAFQNECNNRDKDKNIIDTIAQDMFDAQYLYYSFMLRHNEMLLARMDIFLHGDLTKKRLKAYNWDNYSSEFNPLLDKKQRTEHIYNTRNKVRESVIKEVA
jgi:hypothetical protein